MTTAVILAGGLGTRLRSVVPDLPKPMAAVRGRPFLEHQMDYWIGQDIDRFILSVGYRADAITDHFGSHYRGVAVEYAIEQEPLGTGGGLLLAAQGMREPFLVLNGDSFFAVSLAALLSFHRARNSSWTLALFPTREQGRYMGIDLAADGRVVSIKADRPGNVRLANGGAYLVTPNVLDAFSNRRGTRISLEDEILPAIAATKSALYGMEFKGLFIDIGVPADYLRAPAMLP
jgi:D-glycero-alpha-D-manno-heptose 1-phosphate guanylyltransferase